MAKRVERTAPGSKNDWRVTYNTGSKKWTNDRPGDGKGDPEELEETFDDLTVKRGLKRLEKAVNAYIKGKGTKAIKEAVEALEVHAGKDAAKTAIRKVHSIENTELKQNETDLQKKIVEGLGIAKDHLNRDRKGSEMRRAARELIKMARSLMATNPYKDLDDVDEAKRTMAKEFPKLKAAARAFIREVKKLFPQAKLKTEQGFSTDYSSVFPYVGVDVSSPSDTRAFFKIRATFPVRRKYDYSSELALGELYQYRVEVRLDREVYARGEYTGNSANKVGKEAIKYLQRMAEDNPDRVMRTIGLDPHVRPEAKKPTIDEIKRFVHKNSWLEAEEEKRDYIEFGTREHGDMAYDEPGNEDIRIANKVGRALLDQYGSNNITVRVHAVDEWVFLSVSLK